MLQALWEDDPVRRLVWHRWGRSMDNRGNIHQLFGFIQFLQGRVGQGNGSAGPGKSRVGFSGVTGVGRYHWSFAGEVLRTRYWLEAS